jgi:hypothetical protein
MKIAILTFQDSLNYGAAIQMYALQQTLKSMNIYSEIIDYVNRARVEAYNTVIHAKNEIKRKNFAIAIKYSLGTLYIKIRRKKFKKFCDENLNFTNKKYKSKEELETLNYIFDKFIVGSDQVWNYRNNGEDFAYFLNFVKDDYKKISYAPSFGLKNIPDNLKSKYIDNIKRIKYLSTRENYGVRLIKYLTGRNAELVLDPVFLVSKKQWLMLCNKIRKKERYIFCYTNKAHQWRDFLIQTRISIKGIKVYKLSRYLTIMDFINKNVKVSYSISPINFIETIGNAELVVSASFHCIAMSIILSVPFVAILTDDKGRNERILNILKIAGLENRVFTRNMTSIEVRRSIDFNLVNKRISKYINSSKEFLKNAI